MNLNEMLNVPFRLILLLKFVQILNEAKVYVSQNTT